MSTSQTAVVPLRSFSILALRIFRSCTGSAFSAAAGAPAAAVTGAAALLPPCEIEESAPPTAAAATPTKIVTNIRLELDCFCSCAASNIAASSATHARPPPPECTQMNSPVGRDFVEIGRRVGKPLDSYCLYPILP